MLLKTLFLAYWKLKEKKLKGKVGRLKRRIKKEADFSPRTLAMYNLFIFSAQEDHAKLEWNLRDSLL